MDIRTSTPMAASRLIDSIANRASVPKAAAGVQAPSFAGAFDQALRSVSTQQANANQMSEAFQANPAGQSLEQTMVAMQKAQIGFQSALHVRNRLVSAYSDIMNMQV
ncbi:MAG: flagellar hook-basal body complex protein FliE [Pseudomonadota bacterium]